MMNMKRRITVQNTLFVLLVMLLVGLPTWSTALAARSAQEEEPQEQSQQEALCFFFTETGGGEGGFAVTDEGSMLFASAFQQWGLQKIGYPISHRYERDGFLHQAFQKAIMQWRPDSNSVALVNIFDDLHNGGYDDTLEATRQIPQQLPPGWDGDLDFQGVVKKRQALLEARPALAQTYFASANPLTFYGLPTSEVKDMDSHYAIRLQRAVLQEWKIDVPWAKKGEVTIANGGDITKELGALSGEITVPIQKGPCPRTTALPAPDGDQETAPPEDDSSDDDQEPAPPEDDSSDDDQEPAPPEDGSSDDDQEAAAPEDDSSDDEEAAAPEDDSSNDDQEPAPPEDDETAKVCTNDFALVEIRNGLREPLTVNLTGTENGSVMIPTNGIKRVCFESGTYQFSTKAQSFRSISGTKDFFSAGCECWKLFFLFPSQEPCTCTNNPEDYTRLP